MQNNDKKKTTQEAFDEMIEQNEKYKKHVKWTTITNIALAVVIIIILLVKNCCGC